MSFDVHLRIPENSPAGEIVQLMMSDQHVSPEQAVTLILNQAARRHGTPTSESELHLSADTSKLAAENLRHVWDTLEEDEAWAHL